MVEIITIMGAGKKVPRRNAAPAHRVMFGVTPCKRHACARRGGVRLRTEVLGVGVCASVWLCQSVKWDPRRCHAVGVGRSWALLYPWRRAGHVRGVVRGWCTGPTGHTAPSRAYPGQFYGEGGVVAVVVVVCLVVILPCAKSQFLTRA